MFCQFCYRITLVIYMPSLNFNGLHSGGVNIIFSLDIFVHPIFISIPSFPCTFVVAVIYLLIYLFTFTVAVIYLLIYLFDYLFIYLFVCLFIYLFIHLFILLLINLIYTRLSFHFKIHSFV